MIQRLNICYFYKARKKQLKKELNFLNDYRKTDYSAWPERIRIGAYTTCCNFKFNFTKYRLGPGLSLLKIKGS